MLFLKSSLIFACDCSLGMSNTLKKILFFLLSILFLKLLKKQVIHILSIYYYSYIFITPISILEQNIFREANFIFFSLAVFMTIVLRLLVSIPSSEHFEHY